MGKYRSERFGLVLTPKEKTALQRLAERERISGAAVVRRLIWHAAEEHGLLPIQEIKSAVNQSQQGAGAQ
jgi:hypothetical protein